MTHVRTYVKSVLLYDTNKNPADILVVSGVCKKQNDGSKKSPGRKISVEKKRKTKNEKKLAN